MLLIVLALLSSLLPVGPAESRLELRLGQPEQVPADQERDVFFEISLWNVGDRPVYVSQGIWELGDSLRVAARPKGEPARTRTLFSVARPFAGFHREDLFRLMPGRRLRLTLPVRYRPLFSGTGTLEVWCEYDAGEMSKGDPNVFAGRLVSPVVTTRVAKQRLKAY